MRKYHMIVEPITNKPGDTQGRMEYVSPIQGSAPDGYRCVGVCGFHEKPREPLYPCRGCAYYDACGSSTRTEPCSGRRKKREF